MGEQDGSKVTRKDEGETRLGVFLSGVVPTEANPPVLARTTPPNVPRVEAGGVVPAGILGGKMTKGKAVD